LRVATFSYRREELCRFGKIVASENGGGTHTEETMNGLIYLVGLIVVILAVLSFFGLR
jgi:hypothetical protein